MYGLLTVADKAEGDALKGLVAAVQIIVYGIDCQAEEFIRLLQRGRGRGGNSRALRMEAVPCSAHSTVLTSRNSKEHAMYPTCLSLYLTQDKQVSSSSMCVCVKGKEREGEKGGGTDREAGMGMVVAPA